MADESLERITILLQAKDKDFARAMDRNNKIIARFAAEAGRGTTAASRQVDANLSKMGASALNFGKNFAIGLGVGAVTAVFAEAVGSVREVIGSLADLQDAADRIDMGVEDYQALQFGMKLAGVGTEEFSKALEKFNENVGDAARGQGKFGEVLAQSGIQIRDAAGNIRPTSVLLKEFADLVKRAPEGERMSLLSDAFGKVGKSMVLAMKDGSAGIDEMMAKAVDSGVVMDEGVIAKAAELDDKFDALTGRVSVFFKTILVNTADAVSQIGEVGDAADAAMNISAGGRPDQILTEEQQAAIKAAGDMSYEASQQVEQLTMQYLSMSDAASEAAGVLLETAVQLRNIGDEAGANRLQGLAIQMQGLVAEFRNGNITGEQLQTRLGEVYAEAQRAVHGMDAVDGVTFGGVIARLGDVWTALQSVKNKALEAASAMPGAAPAGPADPLRHPGQSDTPTFSPLAPMSSDRPGQRPMDLGDTSKPGGGSGKSGGGGKKLNDEQRDAARLFEQTRTEAEKYAAELLELNDLLDKGYITQDTFNRSLDMAKEKYLDVGGAAEFWKDINDDLKDSILDMAVDGVNSFDEIAKAIKRAALEALLFRTGPLAGIFGGGTGGAGGGLSGWLSGLMSMDGGGDTGMGARSGGLDGKGGFLAVMHPQETVIDRTKGQRGGGSVDVRVFMDEGGHWQARVEKIVGSGIRAAAPALTRQAVGAVYDTNREVPLR